jgi:uncharacterized protein DUF1707
VTPTDADGLRIGTGERDAAVGMLGEHLGAGRIEVGEYEERATAALAARTRGDLRPLFADLPPPHPAFLRTPTAFTGGPGLPEPLRAVLRAEGVLVLAERLRGSITYRDYRAPGEYSSWAKEPVSGTVALTGRRLQVWTGDAKRVDVPFDHPMRAAVSLSVENSNRLRIALTPHEDANWTGRMELRFTTPHATAIAELWGARVGY